MTRYRVGLLAVAVIAAVAIAFGVFRNPSPPSLAGGSGGGLFPVDQRVAAPDFTGIDGWVNSSPLSLGKLQGHVVLVDFWTFSCVNCVRTIPHLQSLYRTYRSDGLVIVGVHSPEFDFEKVAANVKDAVRRLGVTWPVAIDSEMATWNAYSNQVWPAEYLIDRQGRVAYVNLGEGNYEATAWAVAALLGTAASAAPAPSAVPTDITAELYAGSQRGRLADGEAYGPAGQPTSYPDTGPPNDRDTISVAGTWVDQGQYLQATAPGHVRLEFHAGEVFIVAGSPIGPLDVGVTVDGAAVPAAMSGPALHGSRVPVGSEDLYHVLTGESGAYHLIDLSVPAGFQLYTFTFG